MTHNEPNRARDTKVRRAFAPDRLDPPYGLLIDSAIAVAPSRSTGDPPNPEWIPSTGSCFTPQVDPTLDGVLVDLGQLFRRKRAVSQRRDVLFKLGDAARPNED